MENQHSAILHPVIEAVPAMITVRFRTYRLEILIDLTSCVINTDFKICVLSKRAVSHRVSIIPCRLIHYDLFKLKGFLTRLLRLTRKATRRKSKLSLIVRGLLNTNSNFAQIYRRRLNDALKSIKNIKIGYDLKFPKCGECDY